MKIVIGLALDSTSVRAVAVRGETIVAAVESEIGHDESSGHAIASLLAQLPISRWSVPTVYAVVGPASAQVKNLMGIPSVSDSRLQDRMIGESAGRLFLRNGIPLVTASSTEIGGALWGAAIDEPAVRAIESACRQFRFRMGAIAPAVATLVAALDDERIVWRDGDVAAEIIRGAFGIESVRRLPADTVEIQQEYRPVAQLASLSGDAWRFADAYGAALAGHRKWLAIGDEAAVHRRSQRRLTAAAAFATVMLGAALIAPGLAATFAHRRLERSLVPLAPLVAESARQEGVLADVSGALNQVTRFGNSRPDVTGLLAALATNLPPRTAITSLKVDSRALTITVIGASVADAVTALAKVPTMRNASIVGAITRETAGVEELERATIVVPLTSAARAAAQPGNRRPRRPVQP